VSDTPRTDQIEKLAYWFNDDMTPVCESRFVRSLERELNAAHERIRLLISERDSARLQADKKVSLREEFRELLQTDDIEQGVVVVRGLQDRIKHLEDSLRRIANADYRGNRSTESQIAFEALKEAKP